MTIQDWGICVTAIISSLSLLISIFNHLISKPKLKIEITDKNWDCFFGKIKHEGFGIERYIGGAQINIINNSPVAITINSINLIVNNEKLPLIDNQNKYWECVEFHFVDDNGELTTDGSGIYYAEKGLTLPCKINAYDTITAFVLFHNFPAKKRSDVLLSLCFTRQLEKSKRRSKWLSMIKII